MGTDLGLGPSLPPPKLANPPIIHCPSPFITGDHNGAHSLAQGAANAGLKISDPRDDKDPHVKTGFLFLGGWSSSRSAKHKSRGWYSDWAGHHIPLSSSYPGT